MMKKFAAAALNERNSDPWNKGGTPWTEDPRKGPQGDWID